MDAIIQRFADVGFSATDLLIAFVLIQQGLILSRMDKRITRLELKDELKGETRKAHGK